MMILVEQIRFGGLITMQNLGMFGSRIVGTKDWHIINAIQRDGLT
jgi:hypothetical protein